jgi:aspartate racemase
VKTIGLIGVASTQETAAYLEAIDRAIAGRLGCGHTPKVLLRTFDSAHIALLVSQGKWPMLADKMAGAARNLQDAGANCVALCGLGMHAAAGEIEQAVHIPFLHLLDSAAAEIRRLALRKVALLYAGSPAQICYLSAELNRRLGRRVLIPCRNANEVVKRRAGAAIVDYASPSATACAARGIIVLDTLAIHARAIAEYAIS